MCDNIKYFQEQKNVMRDAPMIVETQLDNYDLYN